MAVFLRKLLRIGGLPDELRAEIEAEGVLYLAEYVPVTRRFSGKIPGKRAHGDVSSYVGSLAPPISARWAPCLRCRSWPDARSISLGAHHNRAP